MFVIVNKTYSQRTQEILRRVRRQQGLDEGKDEDDDYVDNVIPQDNEVDMINMKYGNMKVDSPFRIGLRGSKGRQAGDPPRAADEEEFGMGDEV